MKPWLHWLVCTCTLCALPSPVCAWPNVGRAVSDVTSPSQGLAVCPDELGGAYVYYFEAGAARLKRFSSGGQLQAGWPPNGRVVPHVYPQDELASNHNLCAPSLLRARDGSLFLTGRSSAGIAKPTVFLLTPNGEVVPGWEGGIELGGNWGNLRHVVIGDTLYLSSAERIAFVTRDKNVRDLNSSDMAGSNRTFTDLSVHRDQLLLSYVHLDSLASHYDSVGVLRLTRALAADAEWDSHAAMFSYYDPWYNGTAPRVCGAPDGGVALAWIRQNESGDLEARMAKCDPHGVPLSGWADTGHVAFSDSRIVQALIPTPTGWVALGVGANPYPTNFGLILQGMSGDDVLWPDGGWVMPSAGWYPWPIVARQDNIGGLFVASNGVLLRLRGTTPGNLEWAAPVQFGTQRVGDLKAIGVDGRGSLFVVQDEPSWLPSGQVKVATVWKFNADASLDVVDVPQGEPSATVRTWVRSAPGALLCEWSGASCREVDVFDLSGRRVGGGIRQEPTLSGRIELSVGHELHPGLYFVRFRGARLDRTCKVALLPGR